MGCGVYWQQVKEAERALKTMRKYGIAEDDPAYLTIMAKRSELLVQLGVKFPRTTTPLAKLTGHSPGIFTIWHDIESGWMAEARERPGAPPIYKSVTDEVAMAILKDELTVELEKQLLTVDEYYGE